MSLVLSTLSRHRLLCFTVFWACRREEAIKKALVAWLHRASRQTGRNINRHPQGKGRQTGTQSGILARGAEHVKGDKDDKCICLCVKLWGQLSVWIYDRKHMPLTHTAWRQWVNAYGVNSQLVYSEQIRIHVEKLCLCRSLNELTCMLTLGMHFLIS